LLQSTNISQATFANKCISSMNTKAINRPVPMPDACSPTVVVSEAATLIEFTSAAAYSNRSIVDVWTMLANSSGYRIIMLDPDTFSRHSAVLPIQAKIQLTQKHLLYSRYTNLLALPSRICWWIRTVAFSYLSYSLQKELC